MIAMSHQESLLLAYCSLYVASPTCKLVFLPSFLFFIGFILSTCYSDRPSINSILKKPFIQKRIEKFLTQDVSSLSLIKMCIHCNSTFMFPLFYWMLWIMTAWGKISEIFSYSCLVLKPPCFFRQVMADEFSHTVIHRKPLGVIGQQRMLPAKPVKQVHG